MSLTHALNHFFLLISKPFHFLKDYPVLHRNGKITIVNFGIFAALDGSVVVLVYLFYVFLVEGIVQDSLLWFSFFSPLMVWAGSKIYFFLALGKKIIRNPKKYLFQTGFYVQGGILGGLIWSIIAAKITGVSLLVICDGLCWAALIGQFFGRLGCFNYGCCYGKTAHACAGVHYTNDDTKVLRLHPELKNVAIYPTQLYEAFLNLIMFFVFIVLMNTVSIHGLFTCAFLIYYGGARILLETRRGDIYFNNQRNWTTFYSALASVFIGIFLSVFGRAVDPQYFTALRLSRVMSIGSIIEFLTSSALLYILLLFASVVLFVGYGIHGKTLGTFPLKRCVHTKTKGEQY